MSKSRIQRSALRRRTKLRLDWDAYGIDDFAQRGFSGFGFFLQRSVARAGDHAMRENGDCQLLEIVGHAVVAAFEKRAGLGGALQHQSAARADAESELIGIARAIHNFESVVVQAGVHFYVGDGFLHGQHFADVGDRLQAFR